MVWGMLLVGFALYKNPRGISASLLGVVRAAFHPKLVLLYGSALAYAGACVYAAHRLGVWHEPALKATIYWFLGTALILVGTALTDAAFLRKTLRRLIAVTVVVEFVVNVYSLPLAYELVGVFVAVVFSMLQVVATRDPKTPAATRRFVDGVLVTTGVLYLSYFAFRVVEDLGGFVNRKVAEDFLVGPALTLALIPFLITMSHLARWEQERIRRRYLARSDGDDVKRMGNGAACAGGASRRRPAGA